ncbi:MAG: NuoM family protein [Planctomycetota bacterium]
MLSFIVFFPIIGAITLLFIPKNEEKIIRYLSLVFTLLPLLVCIVLIINFDRNFTKADKLCKELTNVSGVKCGTFQFVEKYPWIKSINANYFIGIDGIGLLMVFLTSLIGFIGVLVSFEIEHGVKGYHILYLLLVGGMQGVFVSLDFLLFYIFWELTLFPMYFLIGIWGGPERIKAAFKFFIYTLFGSIFMLIAMLYFYFNTPSPHTFSFEELNLLHYNFAKGGIWFTMFIFLYLAFAIKVPAFPFHTWLPLAHVEAPTAISVILAGILLKMGVYGFLRISYTILPSAGQKFAPFMALIGTINIVYGALCSMAQKDFKKLIAYSSISHMGFCLLGLSAMTNEGLTGATLQMFTHGIITGSLFIIVGIIYHRVHHRDLDNFGGLGVYLPVYAGFTAVAFFASLGLPGLAGFVSEILVFLGSFKVDWLRPYAIISTLGVLLGAGYLLWTYQRIFFGQPKKQEYSKLPDLNIREIISLVPLIIFMVLVGVYPKSVITFISSSITTLASYLH